MTETAEPRCTKCGYPKSEHTQGYYENQRRGHGTLLCEGYCAEPVLMNEFCKACTPQAKEKT